MDQRGEPQHVVDIVEVPSNTKGKEDRVDSCFSKTATVLLGILNIFCGVITSFLCIFGGYYTTAFLTLGFLTAISFFVSGGLAIGGAQSGSRSLQVATMVMSIISAVFVCYPFLFSVSACAPYGCDGVNLPAIILGVMLVLPIISASISSYHLKICCCSPHRRSGKHGGSDTQPNPVNQVAKVPNEITQVQTSRMSNAPIRHTTSWTQTTWSRPPLTRWQESTCSPLKTWTPNLQPWSRWTLSGVNFHSYATYCSLISFVQDLQGDFLKWPHPSYTRLNKLQTNI